ncbi:MAG: serine/threonine protein kinase [Gemmatimonadetes bacterium]|nr:serine/threonine protein kinase [Gemmatimonadota bacterium]MCC7133791.1 serine/threonine protein kinase [Gemmatimonadales bacterium]
MADEQLTPDRLAALQAAFEAALDRPAEERTAFLATLTDPWLASRVAGLLAAHERTGSRLESPIPELAERGLLASERAPGDRIGGYRIVRRIGEGGMGTVYEAVRDDDQYRSRVAIKFLRHQATSDIAIARFRRERQILALLTHPNIAVLHDGGVTPDGRPYFVMELIDGLPITTWADQRQLGVADRLRLFLQVAKAVEYAHQSLVIHRDLKPGNILVNGEGTVKLLDFGIAKLLGDVDDPGRPPDTEIGPRAYTPDYASPEQVRGLPAGTRTDVYAMGVVLFELLAGVRPLDVRGKSSAEIERVITETTPPRPSAALPPGREVELGERSAARARGALEGDLDAIVLMALRKEPDRRYDSVAELARDIRRHLDGLPVSARPDGIGYRFRKLIRRRRAESAAIALAVVAMIGGTVIATIRGREAERERARATEVKAFLATMLGAANPASFGRDVTVREVLDSAVLQIDRVQGRPELDAEVREIIGGTYLALGEFDAALAQFERSLTSYRAQAPTGSRHVAAAQARVSTTLEYLGRYVEADSVLAGAIAMYRRFADRNDHAAVDYLDHRARILARLGRMDEAEPLFREVLAMLRASNANDSLQAYAATNLGVIIGEQGRRAEAESLLVDAVGRARRGLGQEHPLVASILSPLAAIQEWLGRFDAADSTYQAALAIRRRALGPEHPEYAWTMFSYADFLVNRGRPAEGAKWAREVLALRGRSLEDVHPAVSTAMSILGRALAAQDSLAAAEPWLRQALAIRRETFPPGHFAIPSSESILGDFLTTAGRYGEAETLLLSGEAGLVTARGESAPIVADARRRLVRLYQAWKRPDDAARWQAKLDATK